MSDNERRMTALPGMAGIGLILTGIAGLIFAFLGGGGLSLGGGGLSVLGGGLSLLASAFAFGTVFYVCFK